MFNPNGNNPNISLPIRPVLDRGFILFAHCHISGIRIVSFEDPTCGLVSPERYLDDRDQMLYVGKGPTIESALTQALYIFHNVDTKKLTNPMQIDRPIQIQNLISKLDDWLVSHNGTLRAVSDFDGSVIARLEGSANNPESWLQNIVQEGQGQTFYNALACALLRPINNHIQISAAADENVQVATEQAETTSQANNIAKTSSEKLTENNKQIAVEKRIRIS